eukprot:2507316-Rhodomonas_salina.2
MSTTGGAENLSLPPPSFSVTNLMGFNAAPVDHESLQSAAGGGHELWDKWNEYAESRREPPASLLAEEEAFLNSGNSSTRSGAAEQWAAPQWPQQPDAIAVGMYSQDPSLGAFQDAAQGWTQVADVFDAGASGSDWGGHEQWHLGIGSSAREQPPAL